MEKITKTYYRAKDGRIFTDQTKAEAHEHKLENKTIHYIIDLDANNFITAYYLRPDVDSIMNGYHGDEWLVYETESGAELSISTSARVLIFTEQEWELQREKWVALEQARKTLINSFSIAKFLQEYNANNKKRKRIPKK